MDHLNVLDTPASEPCRKSKATHPTDKSLDKVN